MQGCQPSYYTRYDVAVCCHKNCGILRTYLHTVPGMHGQAVCFSFPEAKNDRDSKPAVLSASGPNPRLLEKRNTLRRGTNPAGPHKTRIASRARSATILGRQQVCQRRGGRSGTSLKQCMAQLYAMRPHDEDDDGNDDDDDNTTRATPKYGLVVLTPPKQSKRREEDCRA